MRLGVRNGWLAAASVAGFALVALAARAGPGGSTTRTRGRSRVPPEATISARPPGGASGNPPRGHFHLPWQVIAFVMLASLLLLVIGLLMVFWPQFPDWLRIRRRRSAIRRPVEFAPDDLATQVARTLDSTMSQLAGGQIRDGVILCWHRLEQTAEAAGLRRSPADTSSELADRLLATLPLSEAPLNRLAALYREARFSSHPIPAAAVVQARADLAQLRSELEAASSSTLATGAGRG
ncbi:DUF4129 domain-containing protein [Jatrophihabitans sp.]|uniref:DUF4129 domain-containing protein n=1 Tax=Jatrophihabitans sp. TaxID=1932789 RepID=UPI002F1A0F4A